MRKEYADYLIIAIVTAIVSIVMGLEFGGIFGFITLLTCPIITYFLISSFWKNAESGGKENK